MSYVSEIHPYASTTELCKKTRHSQKKQNYNREVRDFLKKNFRCNKKIKNIICCVALLERIRVVDFWATFG